MQRSKGYTLIETMVTIVIIMILATVTVNFLNLMTRHSRDEALRVTLLQLLKEGRSESDSLNKTITLCMSKDQENCTNSWSDDVLMFVDQQSDGAVSRGDNIISVTTLNQKDGRLHSRFYPVHHTYIQFKPSNRLSNDNGTIWYCHTNEHNPVWAITINRMGATTSLLPDKSGEIKDAQGNELRC